MLSPELRHDTNQLVCELNTAPLARADFITMLGSGCVLFLVLRYCSSLHTIYFIRVAVVDLGLHPKCTLINNN